MNLKKYINYNEIDQSVESFRDYHTLCNICLGYYPNLEEVEDYLNHGYEIYDANTPSGKMFYVTNIPKKDSCNSFNLLNEISIEGIKEFRRKDNLIK